MMDDYEKKQQEKQQLQEAGANTAHVAGKAVATYFGGKVGNVAYDKLSKTKAGQAIENGVGKVISKAPVANKLNKGLNDSGIVKGANRAVDAFGNHKNKSLNKGMPNSQNGNLKTSQGSFGDDKTPQALKNKSNSLGIKNRFLGGSSGTSTETSEENSDENNYSEEETTDDNASNLFGKSNKMAIVLKILPMLLPIIIILAIVVILILFIDSVLGSISPFQSLFSHKSEDTSYIYNENQAEDLKAEIEFNNAILGSSDGSVKGIVEIYQEKYGVTIDWYLLEAVLVYKYTIDDDSDMYIDTDEINDDELNQKLEELESTSEEDESSSNNNSSIDYSAAKKKIETVASMMVTKNSDGTYSTDNKIGGTFYNTLIESSFLKTYYKSFLVNDEYETRKKLVDEIFEYAELAREIFEGTTTSTFLSGSLAIYLQTCDFDQKYKTKYNERGNKIFDNPLVNSGTNYPEYLEIKDYLKGVVMAELGTDKMTEENREGIKAFTIAATTFLLGSFYVDFYPGVESIPFPSGDCRQVSCDPNYGCSYGKDGDYSTTYSGVDRQFTIHGTSMKYVGWKKPLTVSQQEYMDSILEEVFGLVMVKKGITADTFTSGDDLAGANYYDSISNPGCGSNCLGQQEALQDSRNGMTYVQILDKYYNSNTYDIINIKEGLYIQNTENYNYSGQITLNENFHFHQGDYESSRFCEGGSISERGCSVASTAIAISLLTGEKHDPAEISNTLKTNGDCNGNRVTYPASAASYYGLNSYTISKNEDTKIKKMLEELAAGNTVVVARLAPNNGRYKTGAGHYITLVGVKTEGSNIKVLVWDPGNSSSSRDNYWADFDEDILKYANTPSFVVLSRR